MFLEHFPQNSGSAAYWFSPVEQGVDRREVADPVVVNDVGNLDLVPVFNALLRFVVVNQHDGLDFICDSLNHAWCFKAELLQGKRSFVVGFTQSNGFSVVAMLVLEV